MLKGEIARKCKCRRYKATWLCTFPNCNDYLFCKKCRKNHNRRHEENFYPIRELLEEDNDDSIEAIEFDSDEREKLYRKIDDEIERIQDDFDEKMKDIRKKHRKYVLDYNTMSQSKNHQDTMGEFRRKFINNPYDDEALKRLGREYHKYLQESNVQNVDRRKIFQKYKDNIDKRFNYFTNDLMSIIHLLGKKQMYPESKDTNQNPNEVDSEPEEELVESEVRNSTIPKEWDKEDPMEEVNKSLHMIMQNKKKKLDLREE